MSDKTIKVCDFCGNTIEQAGPGHGFIFTAGDYQEFVSIDGHKKEACARCCKIIASAIAWLGLKFDDSSLWIRAGYKKEGAYWVDESGESPGYTETYGWMYGNSNE